MDNITVIEIRCPIWRSRSVGIAEYRLRKATDVIDINISYKNKSNVRHYPEHLYISRIDALLCPVIKRPNGLRLRNIPIALLSTTPPTKPDTAQYVVGNYVVNVPIKDKRR